MRTDKQNKRAVPPAVRRAAIETLEQRCLLAAWVSTDADDYGFGMTAQISGGGFAAGETVELIVRHAPGTEGSNDDPQNQAWQVTDGGEGDLDGVADGKISTTWVVNDPDALGATYVLTATGLQSGEVASTTFTDSGFSGFRMFDLTPDTATQGQLKVPVLGFELFSIGTGNKWTKIELTYTGTNAFNDITQVYLYYETFAGSSSTPPATQTFNLATATSVPLQSGQEKNQPKSGSNLLILQGNSDLNMSANVWYQFYIVVDVKSTATLGNTIDLQIKEKEKIEFGAGKFPAEGQPLGAPGVTTIKAPTALSVGTASGAYGGSATLSATLSATAGSVNGKLIEFKIGDDVVGTATTNSSGVATLNASLGSRDAGSYTITASFAEDNTHTASSGTGSLSINKANAVINVSGFTGTYDGTAKGASGTATGVNGENLFSLLDLGGSFTNVPGGTANWTFAGNSNYNSASGSVAIVINKANAVIDVQGKTVTYDGSAHGASGTATGADGSDLSGLLNLGASFTNVPGGTANWSFAGDNNHNATSGSVAIVINKANAAIVVNGTTVTYDGSAHGASGTATGVNGENLSSLLDLGDSFTNVPGGTANWSFAGDSNYNSANGSVAIVINKATLDVQVTGYTGGTYDGNAHTQAVTVTGVGGDGVLFSDSLSATNAGSHSKAWSFIDDNYHDVGGTLAFVIDKATLDVQVTGYTGGTYDGAAHTQAVTVTGVGGDGVLFSDSLSATNAGSHSKAWSFSDDNYHDVGGTLAFDIAKADATILVNGTTVTYDGNAHGASGAATGVNGEMLAGLDLGASFTNAGTHTANWTFTDTTGNYNDASGSVQIVIHQDSPQLSWGDPAAIEQGTDLSGILNASSNVAGTWTYTIEGVEVDADSVLVAGNYTITATFTSSDPNYASGGTVISTLTVNEPQVAHGIEVNATLVQSNMNLAMNGHFGIRLSATNGASLQTGVFAGLGLEVGAYTAYVDRIELDADGVSVIAIFRMTAELRDALANLAKTDATLTAGSGKSINVNLAVGLTGTYNGEELNGEATMDFFVNSSLKSLLAELQGLLA